MGFCRSCGAGVDDDAKFCQGCGTPVEQTASAVPSVAPGFTPPGTPGKSRSGLVLGLVISAVVILGILGGGLAFAMSKGYGWLPDNLTRKARAEAALEVVEAFGAEDYRNLEDVSTGELKDLLDEFADEMMEENDTKNVKVSNKRWDGEELTFKIEVDDQSDEVTIEPDDSSTDVKVIIEGDGGGRLDIEMEYDDGWKATDMTSDGSSFVEDMSEEFDSSDGGGSSEERACFSNQRTVEGAFQQALANGEITASELSGTVDERHYLVGDYIKNAPTCPTTEGYYYLYDDGTVEVCSEHGHF